MIPDDTVHPPWYRQPWMWLVVGLPVLSIIASLTLVTIAVKNRDDLVRDDWYKAGRAINQNRQADMRADALNLSGELTLSPATLRLDLTLNKHELPFVTPTTTHQLTLVHSTFAHSDMTVLFTRTGMDPVWRGTLPHLPLGKYHLMLEPLLPNATDQAWRLRANDVIFQGVPVKLIPSG